MAPEFTLTGTDRQQRTLREELKKGPVLLVFFKISCPTCHLTLPLLERLAGKLAVIGISQDDVESTLEFMEYFGITYPVLIDPASDRYPTCTAYGIAFVPTLFLIEGGGNIAWSLPGFDRAEMAARLGSDLFRASDNVPETKPGCGSKN